MPYDITMCPGDGCPLPLAAGQFARTMGDPVAETHGVKQLCSNRFRFFPWRSADEERHGNVLKGSEFRQQVMKLIDEAEVAVAPITPRCFTQGGKILPQQAHAARRRRIEPAQEVEQRAFPGAGGPHHRHRLAGADLQVYAAQHRYHQISALERFGQPTRGEDDFTHSVAPPPD